MELSDALVLLSSVVSYRTAVLFSVITPALHFLGLGLLLRDSPSKDARTRALAVFLFPLGGGKRTAAFQVTAWALWSAAMLAGAVLMPAFTPTFRDAVRSGVQPLDALSGALTVVSFLSFLFVCKSMLCYEAPGAKKGSTGTRALGRISRRIAQSRLGQVLITHGPAWAVLIMGLLISLTGVLLLLSVEHMPGLPYRVLYCCLALVCLIIGASSTHGLGGYLRWGRTHTAPHTHTDSQANTTDGPTATERDDSATVARALRRAATPAGGAVQADETDIGISRGSCGLLLTGRVGSASAPLADVPESPQGAGPATAAAVSAAWALASRGGLAESGGSPSSGSLAGESEDYNYDNSSNAASPLRVPRLDTAQAQVASSPRRRTRLLGAFASPRERVNDGAWAFFQPFAGGTLFVVTQAVGWSLFAVTIVLIVAITKALVAGVASCVRAWVVSAGALMMLTQLVLGVSVLTWRSPTARSIVQPIIAAGTRTLRLSASGMRLSGSGTPTTAPTTAGHTTQQATTDTLTQKQTTEPASDAAATKPVPAAGVAGLETTEAVDASPAMTAVDVVGSLKSCYRAVVTAVDTVLTLHVPMLLMYLPIQTFFSLWALTFAFCPANLVIMTWLTLLSASYLLSLVGEPQHTGHRTWPAFRDWFASRVERSLTWWFGSVEVVTDWDSGNDTHAHTRDDRLLSAHAVAEGATAELAADGVQASVGSKQPGGSGDSGVSGAPVADGKYIFGFHPHGLYPTGAGFLPFLPAFRRLLPNITPITLTASVLYYLPAVKDISVFLGFRQVSRRTFVRALRDVGSVFVCPGGQAELVYAYASHSPTPSVGTAADKTVCAGNVGSAKDTPAALAATTAAAEQLPVRVRLHCSSSTQDLTTHTASSSNSSATDTSLGDSGGGNTGLVGSGRVLSHAYPTSDSAQSLTAAVGTEQSTVELDAQDKPAVSQVATDGCTQAEQGACLQGAPLTQPTQPLLTTVQHEDTGHRAGELVIYAGHKGFVRLAIENQASLVPVLALGEVLQLRDLLRWPALLKWSYKRLGFPCPYLVGGRWKVLPWPSRTPLIYVIGKPIPPPPLTGGAVSQADVDKYHAQFYDALAGLFTRHAHRHPAFKDAKLTLLYSHHH